VAAGYSGTPLAKKLGLKDGMRVAFVAMPDSVRAEIGPLAVVQLPPDTPGLDLVHLFVDRADRLAALLADLRHTIAPAGAIWVSWPKTASKVSTDITEDVIRATCLPMGLVDVKVCAVDAVWSGLKLVIRKELRGRG
jgi:hypothetical protein